MAGNFRNSKSTITLKSSSPQRTAPLDSLVNIPELFEEVLVQLPFLDLVIATGVNTTFRKFIFSSQRLKRKLFLLPTKPQGSRKQRKHLDTNGIFGAFTSHDDCLNSLAELNPPSVLLCPFLLEPSHRLRTAHLSTRVAEAQLWPHVYLTNPPCVHAHVYFTYGGTNSEGAYVLVQASRSIYRRDGVTLTAIKEALEQSGSVKVSHGGLVGSQRGRLKVGQKHGHRPVYNTTVKAQVARCEKRYKWLSQMNGTFETQLHINRRASRAIEPWKDMFITSPPCQEACMNLVWEGRVAGKRVIMMEAWVKVRCEQGITLALLVDRIAKRVDMVEILTLNDDPEKAEAWKSRVAKENTLQDQVTISRTENSKLEWRMRTDSLIQLLSMVAPTRYAYEEMAASGQFVTSAK
ncbi:hypothetical protein MBLNU13_g07178t1 [Cladosporium sp. NU13]